LVTIPPAKRAPEIKVAATKIKNFLIGYGLSLKFPGHFASNEPIAKNTHYPIFSF
jgi:hypothetical protein